MAFKEINFSNCRISETEMLAKAALKTRIIRGYYRKHWPVFAFKDPIVYEEKSILLQPGLLWYTEWDEPIGSDPDGK
jgi:hypothetical protein